MRGRLFLAKACYFGAAAALVGWNKYASLYLISELGLSPAQVGLMKSCSLWAKTLCQPAWAVAAEVGSPVAILILSHLIGLFSLEALRWCSADSPFIHVLMLRSLRSAVTGAGAVKDGVVLRLIANGPEGYGRQRMWHSLSWGIFSVLVGWLIDAYGFGAMFLYSYVAGILMLVLYWRIMHVLPSNENKEEKQNMGKYIRYVVLSLRNETWTGLLIAYCFLFGMLSILVTSIVYIQLEMEFNVSRGTNGFVSFLSVVSTVPVYWYSDDLLRKFGHWTMLRLALALLVCRLFLLAFASHLSIVLLEQSLHGMTFAASWTTAVELVNYKARDKLKTTLLALISLFQFTIGASVGHMIWPFLYQEYGSYLTYLSGSAIAFAGYMFFTAMFPSMEEHERFEKELKVEV